MTLPIAALFASLLVVSACRDAGQEQSGPPVPFVEAVEARQGSVAAEERVSGIVRAVNQVAIRPEIEAPIVEVLVRNGDRVREGQPLVRQELSTLGDQIRQAEAALRLARAAADEERARVTEVASRVTRSRALAEENLVSAQELESLEAQLAAARASADQAAAAVDEAEAALAERRSASGRALVRAPISGTVGSRDAEVGMVAGPSDVLFVIGDLSDLIVEVPLTEEMLTHVREGQSVRIHSKRISGGTMDGTLSRISPFLRSGSFSTVGEIRISNSDGSLQPGMFVQVDLLYGESEQGTLVPASALWEDPATGEIAAWVVTGATGKDAATQVSRRPIEIVTEGHSAAAVRGITQGERVVVIGQHFFESDRGEARVRLMSWERVMELQTLQREDVLEDYLARQQRLAQTIGARPFTNEQFLGDHARAASQPEPKREGGV